jgi:2',3'-cyclic-nucleotide 2'-phosphodiesterase (5'-nucleotidase family)
LLLDAGDTFFDGYENDAGKLKVVEATAALIVAEFNRGGLRALVLGDRDLKLGLPALKRLRRKAKFPFLVANLVNPRNQPLFEERILQDVDGIKVGIFGVMSASLPSGLPAEKSWKLLDPVLVAKAQTKALQEEGADLIIALTHVRALQDTQIAQGNPAVDVILSGGSMKMVRHPVEEGKTFLAGAYSKGKYVSLLTLNIHDGSQAPYDFVDPFKKGGIQKKIDQLNARLTTYTKLLDKKREEAAAEKAAEPRRIKAGGVEYYQSQLVKMRADRALAEAEMDALGDVDKAADFISYELVALAKSITHDKDVEAAIAKFRKKYPKKSPTPRKIPTGGASRPLGKLPVTRSAR